MSRHIAHLLMLIAALIWGTTFIAQTTGMETIGPSGFTGARYLIGALAVLPFALYEYRKCSLIKEMQKDKLLMLQALGLGVMMFGGISLQQTALQYTLVANAAFLTTLYVPAVPLLIWLINRSVITRQIWLALGLCIGGSWLLSGSTSLLSQWGDFLVTIGALFWAGHIVLIGLVTKKIKAPFQLAFLQSILCVVFATPPTLLIETPLWTDFLPVLPELVYAGLFSVGIAYTLQLVAQGYASTTIAAFILSLESVFAAISGWLFLSQTLTISAITGCAMIFIAILVADVLPPQWAKFWQKRSVT
jgi:drug/metabolite transporter (DMT)-like permease